MSLLIRRFRSVGLLVCWGALLPPTTAIHVGANIRNDLMHYIYKSMCVCVFLCVCVCVLDCPIMCAFPAFHLLAYLPRVSVGHLRHSPNRSLARPLVDSCECSKWALHCCNFFCFCTALFVTCYIAPVVMLISTIKAVTSSLLLYFFFLRLWARCLFAWK